MSLKPDSLMDFPASVLPNSPPIMLFLNTSSFGKSNRRVAGNSLPSHGNHTFPPFIQIFAYSSVCVIFSLGPLNKIMSISTKAFPLLVGWVFLLSAGAFGQKGVDTQTEKIKQDNNKTTSRSTDAT